METTSAQNFIVAHSVTIYKRGKFATLPDQDRSNNFIQGLKQDIPQGPSQMHLFLLPLQSALVLHGLRHIRFGSNKNGSLGQKPGSKNDMGENQTADKATLSWKL